MDHPNKQFFEHLIKSGPTQYIDYNVAAIELEERITRMRKLSEKEQPPNYVRIRYGVYVIRSGAGLRKACRDYNGGDKPTFSECLDVFPAAYPAMAIMSWRYDGNERMNATFIHLNELHEILALHDPKPIKRNQE